MSKFKLTKREDRIHSILLLVSMIVFVLFLAPEVSFWAGVPYVIVFALVVSIGLKVLIIWFRT